MPKKKLFTEALLEFIKANPGVIFTLTPEQLAAQTGYSVAQARAYYQGIAVEKLRQAKQEESKRIQAAEADVITHILTSQKVRVLYYPRLGEVKIESTYQRKRKYPSEEVYWEEESEKGSVLLPPQDSFEIGIYLIGLQPHIRDTQARLAAEPEPLEPELPETFLPHLTPPDQMRLSEFARMYSISATQAVKYFDRHLIAGEREQSRWGGKTVDSVIIYSQGKKDAWQQLHDLPGFRDCPDCPHERDEDEEESTLDPFPSAEAEA